MTINIRQRFQSSPAMATIAVAFVATMSTGCSHTSPPAPVVNRHAEVIAVDTATGRLIWSSGDVQGLTELVRASIDDVAHVVTIDGEDPADVCGNGRPVAVSFNQKSGREQGRSDPPFVEHPTSMIGPDVANDTDTTYRVTLHSGEPTVSAVRRAGGEVRWVREIPDPNHVLLQAVTVVGATSRRVLYVAVSTPSPAVPIPADCTGGD
jgi:outer membrane protein assembly factor BamB